MAVDAGPWAIADYLEYPEGSRFIQSFKTVAASSSFEHATIFRRRYRFEDLGRIFVEKMAERAGGALDGGAARVVVGRPVEYAGHRPDESLARLRYDAVFAGLGAQVHYVFETVGAASASRPGSARRHRSCANSEGHERILGVRMRAGRGKRCVPLGHAASARGDRFATDLDHRPSLLAKADPTGVRQGA